MSVPIVTQAKLNLIPQIVSWFFSNSTSISFVVCLVIYPRIFLLTNIPVWPIRITKLYIKYFNCCAASSRFRRAATDNLSKRQNYDEFVCKSHDEGNKFWNFESSNNHIEIPVYLTKVENWFWMFCVASDTIIISTQHNPGRVWECSNQDAGVLTCTRIQISCIL